MTPELSATGGLPGKRIVNTRAVHQAAKLDNLLRSRGAWPLSYPCLAIAPPDDAGCLDEGLRAAAAGQFDWLVLTSANTVLILEQRLHALGLDQMSLARLAVAAVGPATAATAQKRLGVQVTLAPAEHVAEALAVALAEELRPGQRIFLPQSAIARPALVDALARAGGQVTAPPAYRTVIGGGGVALPTLLVAGQVDAIALTSASTARNLLQRLAAEGGDSAQLAGVCIACIGPVTAEAARQAGLSVTVIAATHTLSGLVAALETYFEE